MTDLLIECVGTGIVCAILFVGVYALSLALLGLWDLWRGHSVEPQRDSGHWKRSSVERRKRRSEATPH